jgi:hypothetical protein
VDHLRRNSTVGMSMSPVVWHKPRRQMTDAQAVAIITANWYSRFFPTPLPDAELKLHTATAWKFLAESRNQAPTIAARDGP